MICGDLYNLIHYNLQYCLLRANYISGVLPYYSNYDTTKKSYLYQHIDTYLSIISFIIACSSNQ